MTPKDLLNEVETGFEQRKFAAGLAIAFIDFLHRLDVPANPGISSFKDFLATFPRREFRSAGKRANTLIVDLPDGSTLSLRPFYNGIENFFRAKNQRFDYPSCAPHATQAWQDYIRWLDAMCGFTEQQLLDLRQDICDLVLAKLPSQAFDPSSLTREPPLFEAVIEGFGLTKHKGETTGAAYQGLVFGFLRADNPHLQVEIDKVRTGSKRLQRVGDIDAWEGARLAITAEVKQYVLGKGDVEQLAGFANAANVRGAIGIVCSLGFEEGVREAVEELGARALDTDDLLSIVSLWDPMKQRTAVASMTYYVTHVEKNSALTERLGAFVVAAARAFEEGEPSPDETAVAAAE